MRLRLLWEGVRLALDAIWSNKLRSFLTLLANVVAVTSVMAVVSVLSGLDVYVKDKVADEGSGVIKVQRVNELLALSSFVLAAFGMYLLVFDLTCSHPAAQGGARAAGLVAGMIYTFTSYKLMHLPHLQLLSSQWMPFAFLYLRRTNFIKRKARC